MNPRRGFEPVLDYIFFHPIPFDRFMDFLNQKGVQPETRCDDGSYQVRVPDDLADALSVEIEERYDELMALNQELFESEQRDGPDNYHAAGVVVNLKDGTTVYADVEARLLSRVMTVLSAEEFGQLVDAIIDAVEDPDARSLCQRVRDRDPEKGTAG
jgi:hypothetical protein